MNTENFIKSNYKKIKSYEKIFFFLIVGLNLIPVLTNKFFPSMDGAAHLYNSNLINHLLFDSQSQLNTFFIFNPEPVPNWTGHIILSLFNLFFPAFIAEKVLLLFYLIGLPLSFRSLTLKISPSTPFASYLIFPFTYSFVFLLGFYNFSIAIVFMLFTLNFWLNKEGENFSLKNGLQLSLLITLTYFSHVLIFAILH